MVDGMNANARPLPGSDGYRPVEPGIDISGSSGAKVDQTGSLPVDSQSSLDMVGESTLDMVGASLKVLSESTPKEALATFQRQKAQLEATFPDLPMLESPPDTDPNSTSGLTPAILNAYARYDVVKGAITFAQSRLDAEENAAETKEPKIAARADVPAGIDTTLAKEAAPTAAPAVNRFLAGTQYVALNEAIALCAKAMNSMNVVESQINRDLRKLEISNVASQVDTIIKEGERKKELMKDQATQRLITAAVSIVAHGLMVVGGPKGDREAGVRFQAHMQTINSINSNIGEAAGKYIEAGAQAELAGFEAAKVIQRDQKENLGSQRQKCQQIVDNNRDALARMWDQLAEGMGGLRRAMGVGRG